MDEIELKKKCDKFQDLCCIGTINDKGNSRFFHITIPKNFLSTTNGVMYKKEDFPTNPPRTETTVHLKEESNYLVFKGDIKIQMRFNKHKKNPYDENKKGFGDEIIYNNFNSPTIVENEGHGKSSTFNLIESYLPIPEGIYVYRLSSMVYEKLYMIPRSKIFAMTNEEFSEIIKKECRKVRYLLEDLYIREGEILEKQIGS